MEFYPDAVRLLVNKLKTNKKVGAACGRVHPVGSGKILLPQAARAHLCTSVTPGLHLKYSKNG